MYYLFYITISFVYHDTLIAAARAKIVNEMHLSGHMNGVIMLCGGIAKERFDSDHELLFRLVTVILRFDFNLYSW